jgi:hypothetical protein
LVEECAAFAFGVEGVGEKWMRRLCGVFNQPGVRMFLVGGGPGGPPASVAVVYAVILGDVSYRFLIELLNRDTAAGLGSGLLNLRGSQLRGGCPGHARNERRSITTEADGTVGDGVKVLTAVESGGGGRGLRRMKVEAHRRADLLSGRIGASAPMRSRLAERREECDSTWNFGKRSVGAC